MEKIVMRGLLIALCVVGLAGVANAAGTSLFTPDGIPATLDSSPLGQTYYRGYGSAPVVEWAFTWDVPAAFLGIDTATVAIDYSDVDPFADDGNQNVYANGESIGSLPPFTDDDPHVKVFDLLDLGFDETSLNGTLNMEVDLFVGATNYSGLDVVLNSSTFNIVYVVEKPEPPQPPQPPVVPAPAAIILSSLGAGLVGWLRRRSMV